MVERGAPSHEGAAVVDLFAGPGGWDCAARELGIETVGIEWDAAACATRAAAGFATIRADVAQYPVEPFVGKVEGLIASPPCQDFSVAGRGAGRAGEKGKLIDEVPRWVAALLPEWVACEQVPPCEAIWHEHAQGYEALGYKTWVGVLNAADYGVPQTRRRAILLAHRDRQPVPPEPTHAKDSGGLVPLLPWVSMAEALGWGLEDRPSFTVMAGGAETGGAEPFGRHARAVLHTNRGQDEDGNRQTREPSAPAPALTAKAGGQWAWGRPATRIVGSFCPDVVAGPGYRTETPRQDAEGSIKITLRDALILQSFDPDYPVRGSKTKSFEQVGNAIPPLLARHVLAVPLSPGDATR